MASASIPKVLLRASDSRAILVCKGRTEGSWGVVSCPSLFVPKTRLQGLCPHKKKDSGNDVCHLDLDPSSDVDVSLFPEKVATIISKISKNSGIYEKFHAITIHLQNFFRTEPMIPQRHQLKYFFNISLLFT